MNDSDLRPYHAHVPQADLDDLQDRLARVRWPDEPPAARWDLGVPLDYVKELVERWRTGFDWRDVEAGLNRHQQFTTTLDGESVYFIHARSPEPGALPLIASHGWPMTVLDYAGLIDPLTDPRAHGGDPADAFHLVIPSIPASGSPGRPARSGGPGSVSRPPSPS